LEFWSVLLTFVYGRLHGERRKTERKKFLYVSPLHHHHHRPTTERRSIKRNFNNNNNNNNNIYLGGGVFFTNFVIKQNYTERERERRKTEK
jgi:hypothetical protein